MLGVSAMLGGDGAAAGAEGRESGGNGGGGGGGEAAGVAGTSSGGFSEEEKLLRMEESERNSGGNRWPRQETLALLQIRSDMDVAFRDSSLKGPLWDEVSRKLAELGYKRSAKKCKEKFENVYKYHRRTKEGRSSKSDGKTYRFFDQLEALENQAPPSLPPQPLPPPPSRPQSQPVTSATPVAVAMPATAHPPVVTHVFTVPSMSNLNPTTLVSQSPISINPPPSSNPLPSLPPPVIASPISYSYQTAINPPSHIKIPVDIGSISTSSSTSSDEEPERRGRRKRKWGDFFQRLMTEVVEKQEEMQKKFLETLDRRERERVAREEAWRAQEMARMNREHELLVHERSVAAAKDAAVIQFLQKISDGQQQIPNAPQMQESNPAPPPPQPQQPPPQPAQPQPPAAPRQTVLHPPLQPQLQSQPVLQPTPPPQPQQLHVQTPVKGMEVVKTDNGGGGGGGGESHTPTSSSRWPKAEVEALIRLRTNMDTKYQENVPKGPLWEEISAAMRRIGYDRNAKRCKEKWENINKYFKKVKESNKKRPEDSKTCPYFQQLDELYREKAKNENNNNNSAGFNAAGSNAFGAKPAESVPGAPIMVQPEQQYRPNEDEDSQNIEEDDGEEEEDDDDDEAGGYEVVPNRASNSVGTTA
ncbi:hypothetical protein RHMOL_Rhmol11G0142100 [Rhododendron molle]|uniref:Uncharacterized protein n=1 Tax=Rhododendron molle TaxID=49168 RepID=A0ACC0LTA6_RHOML|nr:hypothetical protein RHMOL_Rhmol11G0142100 [Rhododendron molle]